ncbi:flagellar basal body P-ring formation chaperone FlgA [Pollutimonas bauzanensis]|uniref:Flagella basal body P-ring formation protein FlgA n=1 Tax=Pollutimonas bauzanensis TaxID=658167 RepID=A0A1M5Z4X5_9BURK|nr:flagellar basal body P-ring formation chaperone FlgA [Pollutimonas bauzanensis]SHI19241.1 flagella basal body P-ring formation protein FlgA [Pollutimonas bauzanensis]
MLKFSAIPTLLAAGLLAGAACAAPAGAALPAQDPAQVADVVERFLAGQAGSYPGAAHIIVEAPRIDRQAACDQLQAFLPSGQRLRSRMTVGVRCMAPEAWTSYVQANLSIQGFYYVANHNIQAGDTLTLSDLTGREGDLLRLNGGVVFDPSQAIGYIAAQRIPAGGIVKSSALRNPDSIQRGQKVRTEARGPGFVATGEGQAMQGGAPGTQIQVKSSSGQIVSGTVLNSNTVQVMM